MSKQQEHWYLIVTMLNRSGLETLKAYLALSRKTQPKREELKRWAISILEKEICGVPETRQTPQKVSQETMHGCKIDMEARTHPRWLEHETRDNTDLPKNDARTCIYAKKPQKTVIVEGQRCAVRLGQTPIPVHPSIKDYLNAPDENRYQET